MASFVNEPNKTNDPSYLGTSQGTEKAGFQQLASTPDVKTSSVPDYKSDTTYGKLFAGVGDVLDVAVKGTDTAIKDHIKEDLYSRIDNIRDQFGVAQAANSPESVAKTAAAGSEGVLPKAVEVSANRLGNKLDNLKSMYQNGELQDSAYWGRVESEIRSVRAQYPGYRDYIDEKTSNIVGTTPANALRRSLLSDVADLYKKQMSSTDKWTTYVHQNDEIIQQIYPNYSQLRAQGKEPPQAVVEDAVAKFKSTDANYDRDLKRLNAKSATGKDNVDDAASTFAARGDQIVTRLMSASSNVAGMGSYQDFFTKTQNKVTSGGVLTPEELDQVRNGFAQLKLKVQTELQKELTRSWSDTDPNSRSFSHIFGKDPTRLKAVTDQIMSRIGSFETAITDKDTGLLGTLGASNKAVEDSTTAEMFRINDTWRKLPVANKLLGPNATALILPEVMDRILPGLREVNSGQITLGGEKDYSNAWKRFQDKKAPEENYKVLINDGIAAVTKAQDPKAVINHATALFSLKFNFLEKVGPLAERNNMYATLTAPDVAKRMADLKGTAEGQQAWNDYTKWTTFNAYGLVKQQADSLQEAVSDSSIKLNYDPKSHSFSMDYTNSYLRKDSYLDKIFGGGSYAPALQEVNKTLRNYAQVMKADGKDPTAAVNNLAASLVNTAAPKSKGFLESLSEAVKAHVGENGPLAPSKPTSTPVKAGNISDSPVIAIDTKDIPEGMSARDFIKQLQDKNRPQR